MKAHKQYNQIFKPVHYSQISQNIEDGVMGCIQATRARRVRLHLIGYSLTCGLAFVGVIPSTIWFINATKNSGFYEYFTLFFSDSVIAFANWKALVLSMAQSLPIIETALVIGTVLLFAKMLRSIVSTMNEKIPITGRLSFS